MHRVLVYVRQRLFLYVAKQRRHLFTVSGASALAASGQWQIRCGFGRQVLGSRVLSTQLSPAVVQTRLDKTRPFLRQQSETYSGTGSGNSSNESASDCAAVKGLRFDLERLLEMIKHWSP